MKEELIGKVCRERRDDGERMKAKKGQRQYKGTKDCMAEPRYRAR